MPVGPNSTPEHVRDTVDSFRHYMAPDETALLVLDDTGGDAVAERLPDTHNVIRLVADDLLPGQESLRPTTFGLLFAKQAAALESVADAYDWRCLMRLDDDALLLGPNPHHDALTCFERWEDVGMLGAYLRRGDGTDKQAAMAQKGRKLLGEVFSRELFRHPRKSRLLVRLVVAAKRNGYRLGDMCTGGSFFLSRRAYDSFRELWRGDALSFRFSSLEDDLLFALHTAAGGFRLADFPAKSDIMAINWRGLPMPLEELVERGKKVVHPVKDPDDPTFEPEVRRYFRERRSGEGERGDPGAG
jgi:hypothetical protein